MKTKEFEGNVERVKKINDTLKEAGMDWEQIDRFWAKIIKKAKKKGLATIHHS